MRSAPSLPPKTPGATHARLLDAAFRVCAERGLHAATTREIAEAAQVNEVTLFRHFGSKEKLIAALFQRSVAAQAEALSDTEPTGENLPRNLLRYARRFNAMLFAHEAFIRTMIGEARRYPAEARQVIGESVKPMRQRFIAYLGAAQKAHLVRRDLDLAPAFDAFNGMLLSGMLRRTVYAGYLDYSQDDYVATAVEIFLRGIAAPKPVRKVRRPR